MIKKTFNNISFNIDFSVISNLIDTYEENIAQYKAENKNKYFTNSVVLTLDDIIEFVYNTFEDDFSTNSVVTINEDFFKSCFKDFYVKAQLQKANNVYRFTPVFYGEPNVEALKTFEN